MRFVIAGFYATRGQPAGAKKAIVRSNLRPPIATCVPLLVCMPALCLRRAWYVSIHACMYACLLASLPPCSTAFHARPTLNPLPLFVNHLGSHLPVFGYCTLLSLGVIPTCLGYCTFLSLGVTPCCLWVFLPCTVRIAMAGPHGPKQQLCCVACQSSYPVVTAPNKTVAAAHVMPASPVQN